MITASKEFSKLFLAMRNHHWEVKLILDVFIFLLFTVVLGIVSALFYIVIIKILGTLFDLLRAKLMLWACRNGRDDYKGLYFEWTGEVYERQ